MLKLNKIYNTDCLKGMKQMEDNSVDMVITSPPYNYNLRIHYGEYGVRSVNDHNKYDKKFSDDLPMQEYFEWQKNCIEEMIRVSKCLVFYNIQMLTGNKVAIFQLFGYFSKQIKEIIIWDKINAEPAMHEGILNSQYEFIVVFDKKNAIARQFIPFNAKRGTEFNVFKINKNQERGIKGHSAMFPLALPRKIMLLFGNDGDTILDPFMGSGTTAVAAIREKRNFIGFELNKDYFEKANKRINNELKQPTLF